jgi:TonB family protein
MRRTGLLLALLLPVAGTAWAQQELAPSTDDGPLAIKPEQPKPDMDGVYQIGPGIAAPVLVRIAPALYPPGITGIDVPHVSIVSAVIGIDGAARNIQVINARGTSYDQPAIEAVKQSQFEAGTLNGDPVPVQIYVRVPFSHLRPAIPMVLQHYPPSGGRLSSLQGGWQPRVQGGWQPPSQDDPFKMRTGDTPPKPINSVIAQFSEQARRERFEGVVIVSMIVNEEGVPIDLRVERSIGHGLDEKALEAASESRFLPAMRDGRPVAVRISIETAFNLKSK